MRGTGTTETIAGKTADVYTPSGARPRYGGLFLHGSGLEWLHRLVSEPRRLWHRYLVGNPRFLVAAWRHRP